MIYSGSAISVSLLDDGIAELKFDLANESVNKFDRATLAELAAAELKFDAVDVIRTKRDGGTLADDELRAFIPRQLVLEHRGRALSPASRARGEAG